MIRRPPRSTLDRSSAASDVYKRQAQIQVQTGLHKTALRRERSGQLNIPLIIQAGYIAVSYTHLRAHETVLDIVCRLLLEKKKKYTK